MLEKFKSKVSTKNRIKKYSFAVSYIKKDDVILDIGVDPTLGGTTNYFEKFYDLPNKLVCLGVNDDFSKFKTMFPDFELVLFDGFNFPKFKDKFDFAFSNAVIEHVGNYDSQIKWVTEISKITNTFFVTTPNRWLPFETHTHTFFFHWFPDKIRDFFYKKIGKERYTKNYMWLLGEKDFKKILINSGFEIIHFHKNKFLFFTIDFVAICRAK
jgi:hypothetical protein